MLNKMIGHDARKSLTEARTIARLALAAFIAVGSQSPAMAEGEVGQTNQVASQDKVEKQPEVRVGELSFKVTSLRISRERYGTSVATLALTITNHGKEPLALNYKQGSASLVNEHGYKWEQRQVEDGINGLATETRNSASVDYVIDPSSQLSATLTLRTNLKDNQSTGNSFNLQAVFSTFKDLGEGRLKKIRSYPVSFRDMKKSSFAESATQGVKDNANKVGGDLKKALGQIFGN